MKRNSRIYLVTTTENGKKIVSHGVRILGNGMGKDVVLPCETLDTFRKEYGAQFDQEQGAWYITGGDE